MVRRIRADLDLRMLSSKPAGSAIHVIEEQPSKAPSPMLVRLAGSSIDVIEEQPEKAFTPRLVRRAGSAIDVNAEQSQKAKRSGYATIFPCYILKI